MGIYGSYADLMQALRHTLEHGEPMLKGGERLMDIGHTVLQQGFVVLAKTADTMSRGDRVLGRLERLTEATEAFLALAIKNAVLEQRRLELEVAQLERDQSEHISSVEQLRPTRLAR